LIKRKRTFKAYDFLLLMVIGQMGMKHPSLAGMVASIRAEFSRVALHKRFSPQAVAFMRMCLMFALKQKMNRATPIDAKALRPFSRVMLLDSSAWNVHPSLEGVLPGKRRRDLKARTRRHRKECTKRSLALCGWTLLITNAPARRLSARIALDLYMLRWQIELLFKQLKSILQIHHTNTGREPRLRCELYGKLIGAVLIHRIHAVLNPRTWNTSRKELSMEKLYKRIQERAFTLLGLMLISTAQAVAYLAKELQHIARHCIKSTQPSRPTTLEVLDRTGQFDVEVLTISPLS